jgi:hypothetical protein
MAYAGLRWGELAALTVRRVDACGAVVPSSCCRHLVVDGDPGCAVQSAVAERSAAAREGLLATL